MIVAMRIHPPDDAVGAAANGSRKGGIGSDRLWLVACLAACMPINAKGVGDGIGCLALCGSLSDLFANFDCGRFSNVRRAEQLRANLCFQTNGAD
jgi:hypothetical protein